MPADCFTLFEHSISQLALPEKFTFPFFYQPHPIAEQACFELQQKLKHFHPLDSYAGRMYGVLVVQNPNSEIGYLSALSGNTNDVSNDNISDINFVPSIVEVKNQDSKWLEQHRKVNEINHTITEQSTSLHYQQAKALVESEKSSSEFQTSRWQKTMVEKRKARKLKRTEIDSALSENTLSEENHKTISIALSRESVEDKKILQALKSYWQSRISSAEQNFAALDDVITRLKKDRRKLSNKLQKQLFKQYQLLNAHGETKDLIDIFSSTVTPTPPAGAGDCALPKLVQYAYLNGLRPLCMAEFWWGKSSKSTVRNHLNYYPSCTSKCQPILGHMLDGLKIDDNPLLENPAKDLPLPIIYQDEHLVVVNKPAGMLSVPGKNIKDSAASRLQELIQTAKGPMVLHRLDMATSGLLVFSLNERAHKHLQQQFIEKQITKQYVALVVGEVSKQNGEINLPLILDIEDRPRQKVCFEHGKPAQTKWQVLNIKDGKTRLALSPITGRTHQLRMHCAHIDGLNTPIVGDTLYGKADERLCLHAQKLSFIHPISKEVMSFEVAPDF